MKKGLSLLMAVMLALAWYVTISSWVGNDDKYQGYIEEAKRLEEKGLYLDAVSVYEKAKEIRPNLIEVDEYIADAYLAMGNQKDYKKKLNSIISKYGPVEQDIIKLYDFYKKYSTESSLAGWLADMYDKYPDSVLVKEYYNTVKGIYDKKFINVDQIDIYNGKYAVYKQNGKSGLLDSNGKIKIEAVYDEIIYNGKDEDKIIVRDGNHYFFINIDGYKTKDTETEYEYLSTLSQNRIVAKKNGKYGYLDNNLKEKLEFGYDGATPFYESIAAVKQGDKWALINRKGETVTEYIYDDVAVNSAGLCSVNGVVWVKQNGSWILVDKEGVQKGSVSCRNVKAFEGSEPCAVCNDDGEWGYADTAGNLVIDYGYEDAKSFSNGYAPVESDGIWGFIDLENFVTIDYIFVDALQFSSNGLAPVSLDGSWTLIELKSLK